MVNNIRRRRKEDIPENGHSPAGGEQSQDNHVDEPREVLDLGIMAVIRLEKTQSQLLKERRQDVDRQRLR